MTNKDDDPLPGQSDDPVVVAKFVRDITNLDTSLDVLLGILNVMYESNPQVLGQIKLRDII